MRIVVTGSVATDHLMTFPGRFADALVADKLESLSVSFLVDSLEVRRGGVGANISFGLAMLGIRPVLLAAVGADFVGERAWLDDHGVDTASLHVSSTQHTARFVCTTDRDANQIASFYPGAMSEARDIELAPVATRLGGIDLLVVGASDPDAMARHTREARASAIPFVADPSQQLSSLSGEQVTELVEGAKYLFSNEYESALIERRTGWNRDDILARVGTRITTLGAKGAVVEAVGQAPVEVGVPREVRMADPTGVGDAFRAGYLAGVCWGLPPERSAQLGCMMATLVVETVGTQEYDVDPAAFLARFADAYGQAASGEIARALRPIVE